MKKAWLIIIFIQFQLVAHANKYLSGEFSFDILSTDSIFVRLILVRDCLGSAMQPVKINVFCAENEMLLTQLVIDVPAGIDVTNACPLMGGSRCANLNSVFPFGFEQYTFQKLLILPDTISCCKLRFSFQDCCRSLNIQTTAVNQPFYTESEINRCMLKDYSIKFNNPSAFIYITHVELIYSQAFTISGTIDSINCLLIQPLNARNSLFIYSDPYSYSKPLYFKGFPDTAADFPAGFHVDSHDGKLSFTGDTPQTTVMSLLYRLFLKGNIVAQIRREMYIAIMDYPVNHLPGLIYDTSFKEVRAGDTVIFNFKTFDQDTSNTLLISYSGNLPGAIWQSENGYAKHPSAMLSWATKKEFINTIPYQFSVSVSDNHCPSHGSVTQNFFVLVSETGNTETYTYKLTLHQIENGIYLTLPAAENSGYLITFIDFSGKIYLNKVSYKTQEYVSLGNLPSGIYCLIIKNLKDNSSSNSFFIIRR